MVSVSPKTRADRESENQFQNLSEKQTMWFVKTQTTELRSNYILDFCIENKIVVILWLIYILFLALQFKKDRRNDIQ